MCKPTKNGWLTPFSLQLDEFACPFFVLVCYIWLHKQETAKSCIEARDNVTMVTNFLLLQSLFQTLRQLNNSQALFERKSANYLHHSITPQKGFRCHVSIIADRGWSRWIPVTFTIINLLKSANCPLHRRQKTHVTVFFFSVWKRFLTCS